MLHAETLISNTLWKTKKRVAEMITLENVYIFCLLTLLVNLNQFNTELTYCSAGPFGKVHG